MSKTQIRLAGILPQTLANGPGVRRLYFSQGCKHHCKGCFNPETWSFTGGKVMEIEPLLQELDNDKDFLDGITFGGGDPMEQPEEFTVIAKFAKSKKINVWCYTGYTWEELLLKMKDNKSYVELFKYIDVLVDGRFVQKLLTTEYKYRGSSNQRLIDVQKTLKQRKIVHIKL